MPEPYSPFAPMGEAGLDGPPVKRDWTQTAAAAAAGLLLAAMAYHFFATRYHWFDDFLGQGVSFWDSRVFAAGAERVAAGQDPYAGLARETPGPLPYISPPAFTHLLGALSRVFGNGLFDLLALGHVVALVAAPLLLSRWFLGRGWSDAALGYGLFLGGFGAYGVTTVLAGNFGSTLYLLIFAGLAHALKTRNWLWFHAAVLFAAQVKMPYALFWAVPVMLNGWDWRQLRDAAVAGALALAPYLASAAVEPAFFTAWIGALTRQVSGAADVGVGVYGATVWALPKGASTLPATLAHVALCAAVFGYLLRDRARGTTRLAALIVFVILANPRMKEYDIAFAAIPAAALYIDALAARGAPAWRRLAALALIVAMAAAIIKIAALPRLGFYIYPAALVGALAAGRVMALRAPGRAPAPA